MTIKEKVKKNPKVQDAYKDSNGVWIELFYGWHTHMMGEGYHIIHEDTWMQALRELRTTGVCNCKECKPKEETKI